MVWCWIYTEIPHTYWIHKTRFGMEDTFTWFQMIMITMPTMGLCWFNHSSWGSPLHYQWNMRRMPSTKTKNKAYQLKSHCIKCFTQNQKHQYKHTFIFLGLFPKVTYYKINQEQWIYGFIGRGVVSTRILLTCFRNW